MGFALTFVIAAVCLISISSLSETRGEIREAEMRAGERDKNYRSPRNDWVGKPPASNPGLYEIPQNLYSIPTGGDKAFIPSIDTTTKSIDRLQISLQCEAPENPFLNFATMDIQWRVHKRDSHEIAASGTIAIKRSYLLSLDLPKTIPLAEAAVDILAGNDILATVDAKRGPYLVTVGAKYCYLK